MSKYSDSVFNGLEANTQDWTEHLKIAHENAPGMTPKAFADHKTEDGLNSYQVLASALNKLKGDKRHLLDLACGDGHLVPHLQEVCGRDVWIIGSDMSKHEIDLARARKYEGNIMFRHETADRLSAGDRTIDAVVCHMALMLMSPIDPVVDEIYRVLRKGGMMAAIIGTGAAKSDFYGVSQKVFTAFIREYYPKFGKPLTGDAKVSSVEGIREVFTADKFSQLKIRHFSLIVKLDPQGVWKFFENRYLIDSLPEEKKAILRDRLTAAASDEAGDSGALSFEFPMRLITCLKR